jgi:signal transduction histidine kinase
MNNNQIIKNPETYAQAQELREPLTNIMGLIELLEQEPFDPLKSEIINMLKISAQALDTATRTVITFMSPNTIVPNQNCLG